MPNPLASEPLAKQRLLLLSHPGGAAERGSTSDHLAEPLPLCRGNHLHPSQEPSEKALCTRRAGNHGLGCGHGLELPSQGALFVPLGHV